MVSDRAAVRLAGNQPASQGGTHAAQRRSSSSPGPPAGAGGHRAGSAGRLAGRADGRPVGGGGGRVPRLLLLHLDHRPDRPEAREQALVRRRHVVGRPLERQRSPRRLEIHRFNQATQATNAWTATGTIIDSRRNSEADTLWDGSKLYVLTHMKDTDTSATDLGLKFQRFGYSTSTKKYTLEASKTVVNKKAEAAVLDKDSTGKLWVTYTTENTSGGREVRVGPLHHQRHHLDRALRAAGHRREQPQPGRHLHPGRLPGQQDRHPPDRGAVVQRERRHRQRPVLRQPRRRHRRHLRRVGRDPAVCHHPLPRRPPQHQVDRRRRLRQPLRRGQDEQERRLQPQPGRPADRGLPAQPRRHLDAHHRVDGQGRRHPRHHPARRHQPRGPPVRRRPLLQRWHRLHQEGLPGHPRLPHRPGHPLHQELPGPEDQQPHLHQADRQLHHGPARPGRRRQHPLLRPQLPADRHRQRRHRQPDHHRRHLCQQRRHRRRCGGPRRPSGWMAARPTTAT